jgi:Phospholipase_D-nuclease N-terminal
MTPHRARRRARKWRNFGRGERVLIVVLGAAELVLTAVAARDLATRDAAQVRGPKALWAPVLAVQPLGPIAYLVLGHRGTFSSADGGPARESLSV